MVNNDLARAGKMILNSKYVVALAGAGISVESGIRNFRGPGGLWTEYGEPPMNGYQRFLADPKISWERRVKREGFSKELHEGLINAKPNPAHYALVELEKLGILKHLITQNVDNLHQIAGSKEITEIHGNFSKLRCIQCNSRYEIGAISLESLPPYCPNCGGLIKGDTVMFGEPIPEDILTFCRSEIRKCDCILLVGTSAFIYPAAGFPWEVRGRDGTLIEVNLYETEITTFCNISLRGKAGEILPELVEYIKNEG
ncbi:MAG: NAD-dependent deacylase [Dehalococcoidales bacterium]|nr:NAD-dependent deacylase [Dehalococcoidales bacterium]